ncbi:hypothetical protein F4861DRAFT_546351 [Xylaria intraflava]|nr:hypothetical protein F4861DRAFT_546351 [Xylaria intraflava]
MPKIKNTRMNKSRLPAGDEDIGRPRRQAAIAAMAKIKGVVGPAPDEKVVSCPHCPKKYRGADAQGNLGTHIKDNHIGTECQWPGCSATTGTEKALGDHLRKHLKDAIEAGASPLNCPWPGCTKSFSRNDTIMRCLKAHNRRAVTHAAN